MPASKPVARLLLCSLALCATAAEATQSYVLDPSNVRHRFDGVGGLSAGASSRLLFDYPEPYRSDILDFLYLPNFGANLWINKVEIGSDTDSTNGAESSHMHTSGDLNFQRGYEFWLLKESKSRNPDIVTYALSWDVPAWVGANSTNWANQRDPAKYFSADNIRYQTNFLKGARDQHNITFDALGIWNERPWGGDLERDYVLSLRRAMDEAGFQKTQIVGSDGSLPQPQLDLLFADHDFAAAEPIQGTHYPCQRAQPSQFWEVRPALKFWADEDFSTQGGDWNGGSCWGRTLLQNYVRLNATATISWSTLWSVYDSGHFFGNGLMYAYQPWSGNYTVPPAIWTSAHVNQFAAPGWFYLAAGNNSGLLPAGGSWTAMVSPPGTAPSFPSSLSTSANATNDTVQFSLMLEKLEGDCLRCKVGATAAENIEFRLAGSLAASVTALSCWVTNRSHSFVRLADVRPVNSVVSLHVPRDTMMTLSTTTGQQKGVPSTDPPLYKPFLFRMQKTTIRLPNSAQPNIMPMVVVRSKSQSLGQPATRFCSRRSLISVFQSP